MINYPVSIVDNFFEDPDSIRAYALGLEYHKEGPDSDYPGLRTGRLDLVNNDLFRRIGNKIARLFYFTNHKGIIWNWVAESYFQKVSLNNGNLGWVHRDRDVCLTAIVYLNPDSHVGTDIYKKNNTLDDTMRLFCNKDSSAEDFEISRQEYNKEYTKTMQISGLYNRLITYDGTHYHAPQDFLPNDEHDFRLTLIYYFKHIIVNYDGVIQSPVTRMHTGDAFDTI